MYTSAIARSSPLDEGSSGGKGFVRVAIRWVGKIVRPSCLVGTMTTGIQALASVPSS